MKWKKVGSSYSLVQSHNYSTSSFQSTIPHSLYIAVKVLLTDTVEPFKMEDELNEGFKHSGSIVCGTKF